MRLLECLPNGDFLTKEFLDNAIPQYAILSHTWGDESQELTFEDMIGGLGRHKMGYEKIRFCGEQAKLDGLQYFWIDTCCINKSNHAELSQAISSMFRWYRNATQCYVFLSDVSFPTFSTDDEFNPQSWDSEFWKSRWFTRGWTVQELLAPSSVIFFSRERKRLGDKCSLKQQIHEITRIPELALQGTPLSQFSVDERLLWIERRQTKLEEDKVYSLLGIFDVEMPLFYGEGVANAFSRLREVIDKREKCIQDLRLTDPRDHKKRIEDIKGGLLEDSCHWILENSDFQQWLNDRQSRLLWIKGDPGKGKTMLLCGIINELNKSTFKTTLLSYFFCVATDSRINNATAVLRGLIFMLVSQQPSLVSHIRKKYDHAGKALFEDSNAWFALSDMFTDILQDQNLDSTYLIIDALDECVAADLPKLLDFIAKKSSISPRVKWLVSSRNWPSIEKHLDAARLCLELNEESVSAAVATYIQFKVDWLAKRNRYGSDTRDFAERYLSLNANGTFLWVALVCQELSDTPRWKAQQKLTEFAPGLGALYRRMLDQIRDSDDAELCTRILAAVSAVYRPLMLDELASVVDMPYGVSGDYEALSEIIGRCGSFLTLRERTISFVHQSAKDFLVEKAYSEIYPSGIEHEHYNIFSRSLRVMSEKLECDVYGLGAPGISIDQVKQPASDPLCPARYSSLYWVEHLQKAGVRLQDNDQINRFLQTHFLHWLEALSWMRRMSEGILAIGTLESIALTCDCPQLYEFIHDMKRFALYSRPAIEQTPLQTYCSALIFAPDKSMVRKQFKDRIPKWMKRLPNVQEDWSALLQILEGHTRWVTSVAFSPDGALLASASRDNTVRVWDAATGAAVKTLEGHTQEVTSVAFSPDGALLASASWDNTVRVWDAATGAAVKTLEGHTQGVMSVAFSPDGALLASASADNTVRVWDAATGAAVKTLEGHTQEVMSVAFSPDGALLASASWDNTVRVWDAATGAAVKTIALASYAVIISFTSDGIETNRGLLQLEGLQSHYSLGVSAPPQPRIFLNGNWVLRNSERLLWLPADYRGSCFACRGNILVSGHSDGRVMFMEIG